MRTPTPPRLILASRSPRRSELLKRLGLEYVVHATDVDESVKRDEPPDEAASRLAAMKAEATVEQGALSIGCDTLVVHRGEILGKPTDHDEAIEMVCRLQGDEHVVYTGVALAAPGRVETAVETTRVWFRSLDPRECEEYVATDEPMDKAGAYGIQGFGAAIVERIDGDYFNVMGLPIQRLLELFRRFGWRYAFGELVDYR
jgi:septum formation protein